MGPAYLNDNQVVIMGNGGSTSTESVDSHSILKAVEYAHRNSAISVGLIGFEGGKSGPLVDESIIVKSSNYGHIEDVNLILEHIISQCLKQRLNGECSLLRKRMIKVVCVISELEFRIYLEFDI